jgi:DNA-binding GntR family transcriptional regulator
MSMDRIIREEARLIILRELVDQPGYALSDALLQPVLAMFGISRSREWIREELRRLEDLGAVRLSTAGTVAIATATPKGLDHVAARVQIEGIKRPSPEA